MMNNFFLHYEYANKSSKVHSTLPSNLAYSMNGLFGTSANCSICKDKADFFDFLSEWGITSFFPKNSPISLAEKDESFTVPTNALMINHFYIYLFVTHTIHF